MTELTQKELDILKAKAKLFDMIKERESILNKANELQANIQKCVAELEKLENEPKTNDGFMKPIPIPTELK